MKPALPAVPGCKGEHALYPLERALHAPVVESAHEHLCVGSATDAQARALEFGPQRRSVVELAVVADDPTSAGRAHRLLPLSSPPDHLETAVAQPDPGFCVHPRPPIVGAAVDQRGGHSPGLVVEGIGTGGPVRVEQPGDPAHQGARMGSSAAARGRCMSRAEDIKVRERVPALGHDGQGEP